MIKQSDLSIAILSVGSPQLVHAVDSVKAQSIDVPYKIVRDKHPVAAAFNVMLNICDTPYVIQLDEDMELFPNSAENMLNFFKIAEKENPSIAQMVFLVVDPILGNIQGVKIFAVAKAKLVNMIDSHFPDRDYTDRLKLHGFSTIVDKRHPMGHHARNRNEYELFLKHAVSASKYTRPSSTSPFNSDVKRLYDLIKRAAKMDLEDALIMLGGVYWGLFNEIHTDVETYPLNEFNSLKKNIVPLIEYDKKRQLDDLLYQANTLIVDTAKTELEPVFYNKEQYFIKTYQTIIKLVFDSKIAFWDVLGFGYGEIAVALYQTKHLRSIYMDASSLRNLDNPVTEKLRLQINYCEPTNITLNNNSNCGLVISNKTDYTLNELEKILLTKYSFAIVNLQILDKCKLNRSEFIDLMILKLGWCIDSTETDVIFLSSKKH